MKQKELIPKRRFEEYNDKWKKRNFDEEIELYSGLTYSPSDVKQSGTFVLRSSNVQNGEIVTADNVYVNSEVVNSSNVRKGDIIVVVRNGSRSLIGKHAQIKIRMDKTVIGAFMTGIRSNQSNFINALLDTQNFKGEIDKNLGATINQITNGMFRSMSFFFPSINEQQKIGQFFKHLDEMITLEQRKIDKTKALKSAYLAEMFPAEGEQVPKRRFAGFTRNWEQCKLGNIATFRQGVQVGLERQHMKKTSNNIRFIRIVDYTQQTKDIRYIDFNNNLNLVNEEDIVMVRYGAVGFVGRGIRGVIANNMFTVNPEVVLDKDYLFTFLKRDKINELLNKNTGSSTMPALNFSVVSDLELAYPEIEEQKKIGKLFKQFDDIITNHQHKLDKLKSTKQAYLHEMFV